MSPTRRTALLTPEEHSRVNEIRDEWIAYGLSTEPANRVAAEKAVRSAYRAAGLTPPTLLLWFDSPLAGVLASAVMCNSPQDDQLWDQLCGYLRDELDNQLRGELGAQLRRQLRGKVGVQLTSQLRGELRDQLANQIRDQLGGHLENQLGALLRHQLWDQLWDPLRGGLWRHLGDQSGDQLDRQLWSQISKGIYGAHEAYWIAFYTFGLSLVGARSARLDALADVAKNAGWWWPLQGVAIITERPTVLSQDSEGRLHAENGPAVGYPDGWGVWAHHGVRVPREVIEEPHKLNPKQIASERNVEIRRVMMERFGYERYLRESMAKLVAKDEWGKLWRTNLEGDEPLVMVECENSTPEPDGTYKSYMLRVPPTMRTPRQALGWTFDIGAKEDYAPQIET